MSPDHACIVVRELFIPGHGFCGPAEGNSARKAATRPRQSAVTVVPEPSILVQNRDENRPHLFKSRPSHGQRDRRGDAYRRSILGQLHREDRAFPSAEKGRSPADPRPNLRRCRLRLPSECAFRGITGRLRRR
jgi:hypothetical protein